MTLPGKIRSLTGLSAIALLLAVFGISSTSAQTTIDRLVIMAGTTTIDPQGRHWAYLAWQATEPAAIRNRSFALYAKAGDANSAALYQREAIVRIQTDPLVIQPLLQRSVQLGQDLFVLEDNINNLFEKLMPDPTLPLAQKISAVIRGSLDNPDHFKNLVLMARVHPAIGMCLGWAHGGLIPGPVGASTTFELRAYDRFNPNTTVPQNDFVNGAQFYYFLTARDLLGRDGLVSPGTLITICDRMPPMAPRRVQVVNHYNYNAGAPDQRLQVIWNQNEITPLDTTTHYFIYRWTSLTQLHALASLPSSNLVAGPIAHLPGSPTNSFLDNGPGAPSIATDAGTTFWYTVVALDNGACAPGGNRSPHSAPTFGVLRDRIGPAVGRGDLEITCTRPLVSFTGVGFDIPVAGLSTNARHYRLVAERNRPRVAWAEFYYEVTGITTQRVFIGRQLFNPGEATVTVDFALPRAGLPANASPMFHCRIGAANGKISDFASSSTVGPNTNLHTRPVHFAGTIDWRRTRPDGDCDVHDPHGDGSSTNDPICLTAFLTAGTKEVKFYRRVENGPLTLVCQREADFEAGEITTGCCDGAMPAQSSDICYFLQQFDEHGNAGPMLRIGCVKTEPNAPMVTPILSAITPMGTSTNARMRLEWFCPPYGVERFEVWIAGNPLPPAAKISPDLTLTNVIEIGMALPGVVPDPKLMTFLTRRIGPSFGTGAVFSVEANVTVGNNYAVFVRAVAKDGTTSPKSNVEQFTWHPTPALPTIDVPWPARALPAVSLTNFPAVTARMFHTNDPVFGGFGQVFEGVGIRVGALSGNLAPLTPVNALFGTTDPFNHVYRSARDFGALFPLVVYRAQVTNATFPTVSGDVVQVSPLMEQIAFDRTTTPNGADVVVVHDPFIRLVPTAPTLGATDWELYLRDTQPVVEDATYQYFLVRLNAETREVAEVMPTNPVLITTTP